MAANGNELPQRVRLVEVGPRDGLQNEKAMVPTDVKVALIDRLTDAGFPAIEATAFVSPKWVPQMADAAEVMARIRRKPGVRYPVLTPNLQGLRGGAGGEGRRGRGVRRRVGNVFAQEHQLLDRAKVSSARSRSSPRRRRTACACAATFRACWAVRTKATSIRRKVAEVAAALYRDGRPTRSRSATRSASGPRAGRRRSIAAVAERVPVAALAGHFHDTYGQALTNVYAALEMGVATFDCSVAGLGGCPYAKGATGNVASEDVVYLLDGLGIETGVDIDETARSQASFISDVPRPPARVARRPRARRQTTAPGA